MENFLCEFYYSDILTEKNLIRYFTCFNNKERIQDWAAAIFSSCDYSRFK